VAVPLGQAPHRDRLPGLFPARGLARLFPGHPFPPPAKCRSVAPAGFCQGSAPRSGDAVGALDRFRAVQTIPARAGESAQPATDTRGAIVGVSEAWPLGLVLPLGPHLVGWLVARRGRWKALRGTSPGQRKVGLASRGLAERHIRSSGSTRPGHSRGRLSGVAAQCSVPALGSRSPMTRHSVFRICPGVADCLPLVNPQLSCAKHEARRSPAPGSVKRLWPALTIGRRNA
jgi:hypothetical protein